VVRLVLASVVACLLLVLAVVAPHVGLGMAAGAVIGTVVGLLSLRHTHAEWVEGRGWYTPNPWIGGALSVLLVARLAWRWGQGAFSDGSQQAIQQASPLTLAIAATFIVYGLVYSAGLLLRMRRLQASAQATVSE
jgi:hypothetical protein